MKERILGLDLGTNSIGWSIVDYDPAAPLYHYELIDKGCCVFQEGVKIEKGIESSRASERTQYRHQRIGYWRRKLRKIKLIKILQEHGLCPQVPTSQLKAWRSDKNYPTAEEFIDWQKTDDNCDKNPYSARHICLTKRLDLTNEENRYLIGRAIYHINQRRGFLSNRKEGIRTEDGAVANGIDKLTNDMTKAGYSYLGDYFYHLYKNHDKIRNHYTHRIDHYEKELMAICEMQGLDNNLKAKLLDVIISQRPLKSQKHTVGHCVFERNKFRCLVSHPLYEQFRLYSFLNNIKIQTPQDDDLRHLNDLEKATIVPLFLRKSKKTFTFAEIAKKISGLRNSFGYYKDKTDWAYKFNYYMDTTVTGCPVIAQLSSIFGVKNSVDDWLEQAKLHYIKASIKTDYEIMNDIWHSLIFFDSEDRLYEFAISQLGLEADKAKEYANIKMPTEYGQLSLKAIRRILPYMKNYGLIYSHAALLAKLPDIIKIVDSSNGILQMLPKNDADDIIRALNNYDTLEDVKLTRDEYIKTYIAHKYNLGCNGIKSLSSLYHPSMIDRFPKVRQINDNGYLQLGSPRTDGMRNPMAMHALFRLRHVVNTLLNKGKIDENTTIKIEFARELNDANKRAAIRQWQRENEKKSQNYVADIKEYMGENHLVTQTDILKYKLWKEQCGICLYTGEHIGISELFNSNIYDIEHTIPRSVGGDSTDANLTICSSTFNRDVKRTKLPTELSNYDDILERIAPWKEEYERLDKEIRKCSTKGIVDPAQKSKKIQRRHYLKLRCDYLKGKYNRFTMTEVPEGFSRRQGIDIGIISRYARLYLKSLFHNVKTVKGLATAEFRKIWGIQNTYEKKHRDNHCHHTIDAITIACIGTYEYQRLAEYYHDDEYNKWGLSSKRAAFTKPWAKFTEDIMDLSDSVIICHHTRDNVGKKTRKRIRGKNGQYAEGDTARSPLHQDTIYGAIQRDQEIRYVVRKPIDVMSEKDVDNVVDDTIREKLYESIKLHGSLKKAIEHGIWMNEEKKIPILRVRCYAKSICRPIILRQLRNQSRHEHKQHQYVANDSNYIMGIYSSLCKNGAEKREFILINKLDATKALINDKACNLLPSTSSKGYGLEIKLKIGSMVILYQHNRPNISNCHQNEIIRRLYKVVGLSSMVTNGNPYGTITLLHCQEARQSTMVSYKNGAYKDGEILRPGIKMLHTQIKALVEGTDFIIDEDGEIRVLGD